MESALQRQIKPLEDLSGHLLVDIGVEKIGPSDFSVRTDDQTTVRASRLAEAPLIAGLPRMTLRQNPAFVAGPA